VSDEAAPHLSIVVLGGGTAGWMAAGLMAQHWGARATVTVIESPDIGIIGVGEGSTPQLAALFRQLDIAETEWMPRCNATYKAGISFHGWSDKPGYASYFHPFATSVDDRSMPAFFQNTRARRTGRDVPAHPDRFSLSAAIAARSLAPVAAEDFPFDVGYGYHFDATLVGQMLRDVAVERFGVLHISATVTDVERSANGDIAALLLNTGDTVAGTLFVDASGFRARLIQQELGEHFISFSDNLFNDRAVAMPTPRTEGALPAQTRATALSAGWVWNIPLTNRDGNGYVYSSAHLSPDAAEAELRAHLGVTDSAVAARHLDLKVGRVVNSWSHNCLAIGLAQGFIEPLEATALHIVQATVEGFIAAYDEGKHSARHAARFNAVIGARYDGIRDYIVCHYRANQRSDTDYWCANAANQALSDSLKAIITCWFTGGDLVREIYDQNIARYYAPLSWHCLLGGYGIYPDASKMRAPEAGLAIADMVEIDAFIDRCAMNFGDHAALVRAMAV
jgi:tryptophan 6-halogenase